MEGLWVGAGLVGLTIIGNIIVTIIGRVLDHRKEIKTKVLELAYKEWEVLVKNKFEESRINEDIMNFPPFADYVLYYSIYNKRLLKKNVTEKDIADFYNEYNKLNKEFNEQRNKTLT